MAGTHAGTGLHSVVVWVGTAGDGDQTDQQSKLDTEEKGRVPVPRSEAGQKQLCSL